MATAMAVSRIEARLSRSTISENQNSTGAMVWPGLTIRWAFGRSYLSAMRRTISIRPTPTITPGTIPARNRAATLSPMT